MINSQFRYSAAFVLAKPMATGNERRRTMPQMRTKYGLKILGWPKNLGKPEKKSKYYRMRWVFS
jgi:hypothetical protein